MEQIGIITKPQGIKGEFRARIDGISKDDLKELSHITINKNEYTIQKLTFRAGLYFAGEITDCDAYTGGFNLQIAFSTGMAAGNAE